MNNRAQVAITAPAEAANIAVVRHAVAGLAESLGMSESRVDDLKTVITEACTNVVVHAYPADEGEIQVEAFPEDDALLVTVTDAGTGIQPKAGVDVDLPGPGLRLGLSLIAALSSSFSISGGVGQGTKVAMRMLLADPEPDANQPGAGAENESRPDPRIRIVAGQGELLSAVLGRTISALGSERDLSIDQISDAMLLADAITAGAPESFGDADLNVSIHASSEGVDLTIGPLGPGGGGALRETLVLADLAGSVETLASDVWEEESDSGGYVIFRFAGAG